MRITPVIYLLLSSICAADPFYPQNSPLQAVENPEKVAKNSTKSTACLPENGGEMRELPGTFDAFKLIGLVQFNDAFSALFVDESSHLIALKKGDVIVNSQIEISDISLKSLTYIDWQQCGQPRALTLKL